MHAVQPPPAKGHPRLPPHTQSVGQLRGQPGLSHLLLGPPDRVLDPEVGNQRPLLIINCKGRPRVIVPGLTHRSGVDKVPVLPNR